MLLKWIIAAVLLTLLVRIATLPLRIGFKLLLNTLAGYLCLFALNWLGASIGLAIPIHLVSALVVGIFGLPGVAVLLLVRWICLL